MASLTALPLELLQEIHVLALNPHLTLVSSSLYASLSPPHASPTYIAKYLLALYSGYGPKRILNAALRHPICDVEVCKEIQRIWDIRRAAERKRAKRSMKVTSEEAGEMPDSTLNTGESSRNTITGILQASRASPESVDPGLSEAILSPSLSCTELPRGIFRHLQTSSATASASRDIPPLLIYLFSTYTPSANSHHGYPLCRAVITRHIPLIHFLLDYGADPGQRDNLAVEVAISIRDLSIVKILVEKPQPNCGTGNSPGKRMKGIGGGDRIRFTPELVQAAIKSGADSIVQYFVHEKGAMPKLRSIMDLGITTKGKTKLKSKSKHAHKSAFPGTALSPPINGKGHRLHISR